MDKKIPRKMFKTSNYYSKSPAGFSEKLGKNKEIGEKIKKLVKNWRKNKQIGEKS